MIILGGGRGGSFVLIVAGCIVYYASASFPESTSIKLAGNNPEEVSALGAAIQV